MLSYSEDGLIAEATQVLGGDEEVLAAGVFGLRELIWAQIAGSMSGGLAADAFDVTGLGAAAGGLAAKKAYAESQGVTIQLVVAVTADHIHVLNRDTGGRLEDRVASFDRANCEVTIKKIGLSRVVDLHDPVTDQHLTIEGSTSPISVTGRADKVVLHLLAG